MKPYHLDLALYAAIAALGAAQTYAGMGYLPLSRTGIAILGITNAALVAIKAKRSPGTAQGI